MNRLNKDCFLADINYVFSQSETTQNIVGVIFRKVRNDSHENIIRNDSSNCSNFAIKFTNSS